MCTHLETFHVIFHFIRKKKGEKKGGGKKRGTEKRGRGNGG